MTETQAAVRDVAIGSLINSPLCQKILLKSKNNHKNKRKAFSVAEAMIALLIGSIALGMAAPMITKQIKQNNFADTQLRVVNQQNNNLREIIENLTERIEQLENSNLPENMVAFFYSKSCPTGWDPIPSNWNGRFPRFAGQYTILKYNTTNKKLNTSGTKQTLNFGTTQEDAIRNITGSFHANTSGKGKASGAVSISSKYDSFMKIGQEDDWRFEYSFSAENVVPTDIENRPRAIALTGCIKKSN